LLDSPINRNEIIKVFPGLKNDKFFKIEDSSPNYNCIAWAAHVTDCWWDKLPHGNRPSIRFDGVKVDWPFDVDFEFSTRVLIEIFTQLSFVICEDGEYEDGFKKVVIYEKDAEATHMARQLTNSTNKGIWTSKLGGWFRITHESPLTIEGNAYGVATIFMKKSMS